MPLEAAWILASRGIVFGLLWCQKEGFMRRTTSINRPTSSLAMYY
jgi:hypothetical protein